MRWFCLSLLLVVLSLAAGAFASRPSAAQNKQLTTFELGLPAEHNSVRQKNNVPPLTWDATLAVARMGIDNDNITLTASVLDTPTSPVARRIITAVTPTTPPVQTPTSSTYCPNSPLTRADAAKFILLAKHGRTYTPPAATGTLSDVPLSNPDAAWIEQLAKEGHTGGCSSTNDASKQYCPAMPLTREEMAVFVLRSIHGSTYTPPAATGVFSDVPKDDQFAPWIEQLAKEGISKGTTLGPPPTYSPKNPVSRGEMAVFMLRSIHGGNYTPPPIAGTVVQAAHNPGGLSPQPQLPRGQTEINTKVPGLGQVTMRYCQAYADVSMSDENVFAPSIEQLAREGISVGCGGPPPTTCETPTPASTQNSSTECAEDVRKEVQRLTAEVEQLSKTPRPSPGPSAKCPTNKYGIEFMQIPAGSFMMGSTNGPMNERPAHEVTVSPFCLGQYEVTQAQWQAVMGSSGSNSSIPQSINKPSYFKNCGGNCPVEQVSWNDAQNFINKLNESNDGFRYRLPTEAEWEYACRAGTTEVYAGAYTGEYYGNLDDSGWYEKNSGNKTHAVGGRQPNALGLYDMSGNVAEWCQDWYHDSYNGAPTDGSAWLSGGEQTSRVLRGGSWGDLAAGLRSANRFRDTPDDRGNSYGRGFRVVAVR